MVRNVDVEINARGLRQELGKIPRGLFSRLKRQAGVSLRRFNGEVTRKRLSGAGPNSLGRRTGALARSLDYEVKGDRIERLVARSFFDRSLIRVGTLDGGSDTTYAHVHEFGATIVPKRAEFLTVPLDAALTPAGVLRKSAREYDDLYVLETDEGELFLVADRGNDELEFFFVLRKQVTIPARLNFRKDWNARRGRTARELAGAVTRFVDDWNKGRRI